MEYEKSIYLNISKDYLSKEELFSNEEIKK